MVLAFSVLDGLAYALAGLRRMALQPQITCQADADQDLMIEAEIDFVGSRRAGPVLKRGLELPAGIAMFAYELQCSSPNGVRQRHCRRILRDSIDRPAESCIVERGSEIASADLEHRQRAQQAHLVEDITARLGDRQASAESRPRRIAFSVHLHRRNT